MSRLWKHLAIAAAAMTSQPVLAASIYTNDFTTDASGFTGSTALTTSPTGERFLGTLAQGATSSLTLATAGYSSLTLKLSLYALLSLDGDTVVNADGFVVGPDSFRVAVAGGPTLLDRTFSNFPGDGAAYNGADARGTLGYHYFDTYFGAATDATYLFDFTFAPTGDTTTINFTGLSNQTMPDEGFGIDNVSVSAVAGVPEPSTWALMISGVGLVGTALRRKRSRKAWNGTSASALA